MKSPERILVRATNWVGDAVMSIPALRHIRATFPAAHLTVLALPSITGLYERDRFADSVIAYTGRWRAARELSRRRFDLAILLPNSFDSALTPWLARIPHRVGYNRDGRRLLLTRAIAPPHSGEVPRHQSFYYLELLRRAGWLDALPENVTIRLDALDDARAEGARLLDTPAIGVSPGAAYGSAKRWHADRFAEAAARVANELGASVAIFGTQGERELCESVRVMIEHRGLPSRNLEGATSLQQFIAMAAACRAFLTNDSGAMHIASALGVPTVAVFGATDNIATGPTGPFARVVREPVHCSPCLLRECPIDHRCMTRVTPDRVALVALDLLK